MPDSFAEIRRSDCSDTIAPRGTGENPESINWVSQLVCRPTVSGDMDGVVDAVMVPFTADGWAADDELVNGFQRSVTVVKDGDKVAATQFDTEITVDAVSPCIPIPADLLQRHPQDD